jgi:hypothetical protein
MGDDVNQVRDLEDEVDCSLPVLAEGQVLHGELENVHDELDGVRDEVLSGILDGVLDV